MEKLLISDRSTWVSPKPAMSFRPSVPCRITVGTVNAAGFTRFPPAALEAEIQCGCPATASGRVSTNPRGSGEVPNTMPLKGKPVRATTTVAIDQFLTTALRPFRPLGDGSSQVIAPEKLCRTSKSDEA